MEKFTKLPYLGKYREREKGTRQHVGSSKNISCVKKIRLEIGKKKIRRFLLFARVTKVLKTRAGRKKRGKFVSGVLRLRLLAVIQRRWDETALCTRV